MIVDGVLVSKCGNKEKKCVDGSQNRVKKKQGVWCAHDTPRLGRWWVRTGKVLDAKVLIGKSSELAVSRPST